MSDDSGARSQTNKPPSPASRFLVGILGTLFTLLAICTLVLTKPYFVRAVRRLETARQQRVAVDAVDHTSEKRRLARKPKLRECWVDCQGLEGIRLHDDHRTTWADLQVCLHTSPSKCLPSLTLRCGIQPLSADLEYTPPPPAYTSVAPVVVDPFARLPIRSPGTRDSSWPVHPVQLPPHQPHQRPWTPNSDRHIQLTLFVAMPTPSRPLYSPRSRSRSRPSSSRHLASTSTSPSPSRTHHDLPSPGILSSPYTHKSAFTGANIQQELTLGLTTTPFIPDLRPSLPSSASVAQKQPRPS